MAKPKDSPPPEAVQEEASAPAKEPAPRKSPGPRKPKPRQLPPYKVLLHNDDVNVLDDVVAALVSLTPLKEQEARAKTREAHNKGLSLLFSTHKERAELYQQQLVSKKLTVTIEPA